MSPICLPYKKYPIEGSEGYVAGWGREDEESCMTDNKGPARNVRCKKTFTYKQRMYRDKCVKNGSPTDKNKKCKQFRKFVPDFDWEGTAYVEIRYFVTP